MDNLLFDELISICQTIVSFNNKELLFSSLEETQNNLIRLWLKNDHTQLAVEIKYLEELILIGSLISQQDFIDEESSTYTLSRLEQFLDDFDDKEPTNWYISMTPPFIKDISDIDRNTQGLILSAITYISKSPMEKKGDTVKPLTEEYKGFWRYRIKDRYRLIYKPIKEEMKVILCSFKPRAEAYK